MFLVQKSWGWGAASGGKALQVKLPFFSVISFKWIVSQDEYFFKGIQ
jgi:hypothetical protein